METGSGELLELKYHERSMLYYVVLKHQTIEGAVLIWQLDRVVVVTLDNGCAKAPSAHSRHNHSAISGKYFSEPYGTSLSACQAEQLLEG